MRFSIGMKIGLGYVLAVVALVIIGLTSFVSVQRLLSAADEVKHTYKVLNSLGAILTDMVDIETGQRGYNVTGKQNFLGPYNSGIKHLPDDVDELETLIADNPDQRAQLDKLKPLLEHRQKVSAGMVALGQVNPANQTQI